MALLTWLTPSHGIILGLLLVFAIVHSGLAALRPWGENKIGPRPYRVMFAFINIPLAVILIIYFFNHRYDGLVLWQFQRNHGVKALVWLFSAISFLFLYPATFNLLEIAAISKPQVHLYETGILRICRHPQMVGQVIWCITHTLWLGTTFTLVTSLGLVTHHLFAVWHGDYRLEKHYGEAFIDVKKRTSIIPFLAIFDGRQTLKLQEFFKPAYLGILIFIELCWWGHPWLIQVTSQVDW
ncbi:putative NnrU protein [cyanobacterium endosymbiont of Rhopalodia gibberula]|uniref:NnrU family protein n=1 Tax=cyanobacterium endosymbiont of Rhopalodia gibberula TaxID=1763363 RepID=UPI000DC74252|nr:NnrU family protein [cyanobacterium endosymbiont of Rhopalodia gibberula]BBA79944.1 putative NnrU protein [cyanobacterium endosymbiont of Rhopalodia gibberula]